MTNMHKITLELTPDEFDRLGNMLDDVAYHYFSAAAVFDLLQVGMSMGYFDGRDPGVMGICKLCSIALEHKARTNGEELQELEGRIKAGMKGAAALDGKEDVSCQFQSDNYL